MSIPPRLVDEYVYSDILNAYLDCRKHKRNTYPAIEFNLDYYHNLDKLLTEINTGTYEISPSRGFVVTYPKPREVWAAQFRDRIVHHLVFRDIMPFYLPRFINTNCACIKGRGTLYATNYVEKYCRSITENWHKPAWYLQIDIRNFFVSIDKKLLWSVIQKDIKDEKSLTMRLFKQIIFNDPTKNAIIKNRSDFSIVPKRKSLFYAKEGFGLPIGDLPSQLCASGILLDQLDKYIRHRLRCKYYVRYVDDAFLCSRNKEELYEWRILIHKFLQERCHLELSLNKSFIKPVTSGINFVGHYILPFRTYPRRMNIDRAFASTKLIRGKPFAKNAISTINSYLGLMVHTDSYAIRRQVCQRCMLPYFLDADTKFTRVKNIFC